MSKEIHALLQLGLEDVDGALADEAESGEVMLRSASPLGSGQWEPPGVASLQAVLPQYQISTFLARGGMGAVYKGIQEALHRPVAIKVLPPDIDDNGLRFAERFKREAQAMARLSHPNIVAVFDAGQTADGLLYFVMEYIEGTDVAQILSSEGHLDPQFAVKITMAVCEALAFAHDEGIIHRDIKPSNVMIDRKGRIKVADFGLAKVTNHEASYVTDTNIAMGTPDYIAPEALIPGVPLDARADLYAVGVMLYQMLTGDLPRGCFSLPSGLVAEVDRSFDVIVDKALQMDREKRYSTAREMRRDLERAPGGFTDQATENVSGPSPRFETQLVTSGKAGKRARSLLVTGAVTLGLVLTVGLLRNGAIESDGGSVRPDVQRVTGTDINSAAQKPTAMRMARPPVAVWTPVLFQRDNPALSHANLTESGGLRLTHGLQLGFSGRNMGLRARLQRRADVQLSGLQLRTLSPKQISLYVGSEAAWMDTRSYLPPRSPTIALKPNEGENTPALIQLTVIGSEAHGSINGRMLPPFLLTGPVLSGGAAIWSMDGEFTDVAFILLDGLSESDAKKAAGLVSGGAF